MPPSALPQSPQGARAKTSLLLSNGDLTRTGTGMTSICVLGGVGGTCRRTAKGWTLTVWVADIVSRAN